MKGSPTHSPLSLEPCFIQRVRDILLGAGYTEENVLQYLDAEESITVSDREMPRLLKMTDRGNPLDTFIRMFFFCLAVEPESAQKAVAPMALNAWVDGGLLKRNPGTVYAPLRLVPSGDFWAAFDPSPRLTGRKVQSEHVHGLGYTTVQLLNATIRRQFQNVLDLGTGCGIQGMFCSDHSEHVISTDINPRALNIAAFNAAINGITNLEFRLGGLFDPVSDQQFELITMNPPLVISPDARFSYRDSDMKGDGFVKNLIQKAPAHMEEGGFCQLTAQWAHIRNIDWKERLSEWFEGTGCDAWVLKLATQSPYAYATNWISETEKTGQADASEYIEQWNRWTAFLETMGIEAVSTGIITLRRRRNGRNFSLFHEDAEKIDEAAGRDIYRIFRLNDFLRRTSDEDLLETPLRISANVRLDHFSRSKGEGWHSDYVILRRTKGIHYRGNLDGRIVGVLGRCNGRRKLSALMTSLAESLGVAAEQISGSFLPIIRGLIERGYLLPPGFN